jgi:hypothetical protein
MAESYRDYLLYNHGGSEIEVINDNDGVKKTWKVEVNDDGSLKFLRYEKGGVEDIEVDELDPEIEEVIKESVTYERILSRLS